MTETSDRLLQRLEWRVLRRLDGRLQGAYRTVFRGAGIDFADLRSYTPEDDVRHIDWNVTARLDEPFVRQYTEDRDLTAWLVLDRSASMRFGPADHGKDSMLTELSVCLARLLTHGGNRVGAILYDNHAQQVIPPRTGRAHTLRLAHEITRPAAPVAGGTTTDLAAMLELTAATARRRSLIFVISDFIADTESASWKNWERPLGRLAQRHEVVALRIVDPMELDLPDLGLILVEDAETGEQLLADTSDPLFRQRLSAEIDAREATIAASMQRAGVAAHRIGSDEDAVETLVDLVNRTHRRRR